MADIEEDDPNATAENQNLEEDVRQTQGDALNQNIAEIGQGINDDQVI